MLDEQETIRIEVGFLERIVYALETGKDHIHSALIEHDENYGRDTLKNRHWAEKLENDLRDFKNHISQVHDVLKYGKDD